MNKFKVQRENMVIIKYEERDDGWYVKTPENDEYWRFASKEARERDVKQLINKKWNTRYTSEPDPLDEKS